MKKVILTVSVLFLIQSVVYCQSDSIGNWLVDMSAGVEAHDKRLFDYRPPAARERLLDKSPEFWGTYLIGLRVKRKVWQKKRMSIFTGVGVSYENATFTRPFDHRHFVTGITTDDIKGVHRYKKIFAPLALSAFYELGDHWLISGQVVSNFLVFRGVRNTEWSTEEYVTEGAFELDGVQLRLGLNGRIGKVIIGIHSRVVNFQKIDKIIFNDIIRDPRTDQSWENYNPLRFDLTVGYTW